jgi:hypothetical protein
MESVTKGEAMRATLCVLAAGLLACESSNEPTPIVTPPAPAPKLALVSVNMRIDGDSSLLGSSTYSVAVDNGPVVPLQVTPITFKLIPGFHLFALRQPLASSVADAISRALGMRPPPPPWCFGVAPTVFADSFPPESSSQFSFVVNCPPLEGTATLRLKLFASGNQAPSTVTAYLLAAIGPAMLISITVPTNVDTSLVVRTGMYRLGIDAPNCQLPNGPYSGLARPVLMRRDTVINVALALPCR